MKPSKRFRINLRDIVRAVLMAALVSAGQVIMASVQANQMQFDWIAIRNAAIVGATGYLVKNFFTDSSKKGTEPIDTHEQSN